MFNKIIYIAQKSLKNCFKENVKQGKHFAYHEFMIFSLCFSVEKIGSLGLHSLAVGSITDTA